MKEDEKAEEHHLKELLEKPGFIALVITFENKIAGGLTAYELPMYYCARKEIYIYDVAIDPAFQRMGLGKQILGWLKEYCVANNIHEFFVQAHVEDKHAINFYHSAGGRAERVIHFNFNPNAGNNQH